jgi:hypothetical protein
MAQQTDIPCIGKALQRSDPAYALSSGCTRSARRRTQSRQRIFTFKLEAFAGRLKLDEAVLLTYAAFAKGEKTWRR